jgi:hypothetical protein
MEGLRKMANNFVHDTPIPDGRSEPRNFTIRSMSSKYAVVVYGLYLGKGCALLLAKSPLGKLR